MIRKPLLAAALIAALTAPSASLAGVQVRFVNAERYTDPGSLNESYDVILPEFRTYLQRLGARFLAPGQDLTIDVLHVTLAGRHERGNFSDVRIMREATPPSFRLRYVLREKGKATRSGEDHLTDLSYLRNSPPRFSGRRHAHEKDLLDDWFRRNFADRSGGQGR